MDKTVPAGAALLLEFIYETETKKSPPDCYEVIFGNRQSRLTKPLTQMTLDEVQRAQRTWSTSRWAARFGSTKASSASGAPQLMRKTLLGLIKELRLSGSQVLNGDLQDRLGFHLLKRRGYEAFVAGKIGRAEFGRRLAQEWASFPVLVATEGAHRKVRRGQSYYAGDGLNKSLVAPEKVEAILDRVKTLAGMPAPAPEPEPDPACQPVAIEEQLKFAPRPVVVDVAPVIVEKPVVADPGELEQHPAKSKTVWSWLITTAIVPILTVFNDWRVQLAIVLVVAAFGLYAIKRRVDLWQAVKALKQELG